MEDLLPPLLSQEEDQLFNPEGNFDYSIQPALELPLGLDDDLPENATNATRWKDQDRGLLANLLYLSNGQERFEAIDLGDFYRAYRNRWISSKEWSLNTFFAGNIDWTNWDDRQRYMCRLIRDYIYDENRPIPTSLAGLHRCAGKRSLVESVTAFRPIMPTILIF